MKNLRPKRTAIEALARTLLCAVLLLAGGAAWAGQAVGVVEHLSGPLMDRKADGTVKVLAAKSEVESGDTLVAEKNTYAQIRFIDNSEITLRPGTTFKIDNFAYDTDKPDGDSAVFSLVKGGLRSITGLLGKRNKEKFQLKTPAATIGIRGTTFIAQWVEPALPAARVPDLTPGLHVAVLDGLIVVTNPGGAQHFAAGQFGFVPNMTAPPVVLPQNPGLKFTPPPAFNIGAGGPLASQGPGALQNTVDCIVR
ncbi:FecR family protein [Telluria mixta]|uniref:FecR family protein n=1 Tax=Telluria mixta TaxID=34071 RepID=A0ABT2C8S3_9BURK|nr:FecR family protein [Telluria mixta]MCS0633815.1 FecR family protein [Telluria mixta]WEM93181.1 FecR family protein [Telluria mixta]